MIPKNNDDIFLICESILCHDQQFNGNKVGGNDHSLTKIQRITDLPQANIQGIVVF